GTQTVDDVTFVAAQGPSAFGAGWSLSDVDRLVSIAADNPHSLPAGVLRVYGAGGWRFFTEGATVGSTRSYTSPSDDNGTLSYDTVTTKYTYATPDGRTWTFDSNGNQTAVTSADGTEVLAFTYSGGYLATQTSIDGAVATFTTTGGLLQTIQEVNSRTVTLAYSGSDLTQVTNPDGGVHSFAYDGSHRLTGETF